MLFPIKDYNPIKSFPLLTILFILSNGIIFFYQSVWSGHSLNYHIFKQALIPKEIVSGRDLNPIILVNEDHSEITGKYSKLNIHRTVSPWASVIYSMFMHGSLVHLFGNMLFLWIFGNNIEDRLGKIKYFLFYMLAGIGASFIHVIFNLTSSVPIVGASGAISGIMGAYLMEFPRARIRTLVFIVFFITFIDIPAFVFLIFWLVFQFFYGFEVSSGGVAWLAHVGGFIWGVFMIKFIFIPKYPKVDLTRIE